MVFISEVLEETPTAQWGNSPHSIEPQYLSQSSYEKDLF